MIAGCVILYNPDFEVIENILSYANFVQVLYVVDNSDAKNSTIISAIKSIENAVYIDNKSNLGISSALNIGCEQAEKAGYNWILTMDQDTKFKNTDFFKLFDANIRPGIAIYAASYTNEYDRWVKPYNNDFNEIHFVVTSGNYLI
jgi:rhamnosyltransferase